MTASPGAGQTPLYERHLARGAVMVDFAGYQMPLQYSSIRDEHLAVRRHTGIFDVSHMGEVRVAGRRAFEFVQSLVTNDLSRLSPGQAQYNLMCNLEGGIVDDVIVYRNIDSLVIVVNAACREKDIAWILDNAPAGVSILDESEATALIAVQGPGSAALLGPLCGANINDLAPFHWLETECATKTVRISRTGYTGEDGFEIYVDAAAATAVWDALFSVGHVQTPQPCGLGARDTLRLEAGLRLYGQDMDDTIDPFSCGLGWTVKLNKGEFLGRQALQDLHHSHPWQFVGLQLQGRAIARHGQEVQAAGEAVGEVTSGTFGFSVNRAIATASLARELEPEAELTVAIRDQLVPASRVSLPFYRRA